MCRDHFNLTLYTMAALSIFDLGGALCNDRSVPSDGEQDKD
jgi:hypothetical protein